MDESFWNQKYRDGQTGWDIGYVSPPVKAYIDQIENKDLKILVPGAGNAYEVAYLYENGFRDTWMVDISREAVQGFTARNPDFPAKQVIQGDFFDVQGKFDLIIEQTFFCALQPSLRADYVDKSFDLLKPGGRIAGVLFASEFDRQGPPFGGTLQEYKALFARRFNILTLELCYNSILPRQGNELFFELEKS